MQQRTAKNLNKIKTLIAKGITDQRTIADLLKISVPTVNKICQYLSSGIEEKVKQKEARKAKRRAKNKQIILTGIAEKKINEEDTGSLFKNLLNCALVELSSRVNEMESGELTDLVIKMAEMFRGNNGD